MRKWALNDATLVADLKDGREGSLMALYPSKSVKTLGIHWNAADDSIFYAVNEIESCKG